VNALRRIHAALVPNGRLVDTQPLSPHPPIRLGDNELGTLDMREWAATIAAVDRETARTVEKGLYRLERERSLIVTDTYDDGPELLSEVREWAGTRIPPPVAHALSEVSAPVSLHQDVRLRLYRALGPA
jgi:hypothetical protein